MLLGRAKRRRNSRPYLLDVIVPARGYPAADMGRRHQRGIRGFFVGLTIRYVKVIPIVAVSFYTNERMKLVFGIEKALST
ncbi:Mitochondrial carrier protein LEU5, partial [Tolypocladium capitatum]